MSVIVPRPYQIEAADSVFREFESGDSTLVIMATGLGKAQPVDEPILTPAGFVPMGSLRVGSEVIGRGGTPCKVTGVYPQGWRDVYRVTFTDGSWTRCCGDHLWSVQTKSQKCRRSGFSTLKTKDLIGDLVDGSGATKWFVPMVEPVNHPKVDLPIDPYVLGVLIGDGCIRRQVHVSTTDEHILDQLKARLPGATIKNLDRCDYAITYGVVGCKGSPLRKQLKDAGLLGLGSGDKFIPEMYLTASFDQRLQLLRGLMDTDGTVRSEDGHAEYNTVSRRLADDICRLVRSMGGATRVRDKSPGTYTHNGEKRSGRRSYRITVTLRSINPFSLQRKADLVRMEKNQGQTRGILSILPDGQDECQCIAVDAPDQLYVTRDYIVTHNTVTFGEIVRRWLKDRDDRVLILAHREELIRQAHRTLTPMIGFLPQIEMRQSRATHPTGLGGLFEVIDGDTEDHPQRCVIASIQTLWQEKRLREYDPDQFGLVIVDEAHHSTAKTYQRIFEHFAKSKLLGVTATPKRADDVALGGIFQSVAYEFGIQKAVAEAYLVPVEQQFVEVERLDLSEVRTTDGELNQSDLSRAMTADETLSWKIAAATVEHFGTEPTLIFTCPRPAGEPESQGEQVAHALNRIKPHSAVHLTGEVHPDIRRAKLEQYAAGEFQYLVGCDLFTEGFDQPRISRVVMARPTKSIVYYTQCIGRGTRPLPGVLLPEHDTPEKREAAIAESAKPKLVVLDFVGNSGQHKLISCVDIFAGKHSALAQDKARAKAKKAGAPVDISGLLALAEIELAREEEERQERVRAQVQYRVESVDPFEYTAPSGATNRRPATQSGPATASQIQWIKTHGGILEPGSTVAEAGAVIADIKHRWQHGLCSQKQQRTLTNLGWADGAIPKTHAKALCDFLADRGWPRCREPLDRRHLSLHRVEDGWRLRIHGTPVGPVYPSQDAVRAAYQGLVPANEPVAA